MDVWSEGGERELTTLLSCYVPSSRTQKKSEVRNRAAMKAKRSLFNINQEVCMQGTDHQRFSCGAANASGDR